MTKVTIDRELLERLVDPSRRVPQAIHLHNSDCMELRKVLDAPRQPEEDGLEVVAYRSIDATHGGGWRAHNHALPQAHIDQGALQEPLCRLSDAQRAIAELTDRNTKLCATINRMVAEGVLICDERDTLRQQLAERDAEIERGAIERSELRKQIAERDMEILAKDISECKALGDRNKAREQRDKLIELLLDARHFCQRAPSLLPKIDAALAEVNK